MHDHVWGEMTRIPQEVKQSRRDWVLKSLSMEKGHTLVFQKKHAYLYLKLHIRKAYGE